jgi:hypothetical protein
MSGFFTHASDTGQNPKASSMQRFHGVTPVKATGCLGLMETGVTIFYTCLDAAL